MRRAQPLGLAAGGGRLFADGGNLPAIRPPTRFRARRRRSFVPRVDTLRLLEARSHDFHAGTAVKLKTLILIPRGRASRADIIAYADPLRRDRSASPEPQVAHTVRR